MTDKKKNSIYEAFFGKKSKKEVDKSKPIFNSKKIIFEVCIILNAILVGFGLWYLLNEANFSKLVTIPIFLLFFGVIYLLNKALLIPFTSKDKTYHLTSLMPLLLILFLEAFLVSVPINLNLFEQPLRSEVLNIQRENLQFYKSNDFDLKNKLLLIDSTNVKLNQLKTKLQDEISGTGESNNPGYGPNAKKIENQIAITQGELNDLRKDQNKIEERYTEKISIEYIDVPIIEKIVALNNIYAKSKYSTITILSTLLVGLVSFLPFFLIFTFDGKLLFKPAKDFIDIDKEIDKKTSEDIESLLGRLEKSNLKSENSKLNSKISKLNTEIKTLEKIKDRNFHKYFDKISNSFDDEIQRSNEKASLLLSRGIRISMFGIAFYLAAIVIFQYIFRNGSFETYHLVGIVSCSLLFIFLQFIGAWFLKQYRYFVDTATYFMKLKTNIDRYPLMVHAINDLAIGENETKDYHMKLLDFISKDIKYPESYLTKNPDISYAKEMFESANNTLNKTIETLSKK